MNKKTVSTIISLLTISTPGLAEITTDGTVGPKGQLSGPNYHIGQELGSLRGNNLFHSFGRFNLNNSESATFTGDSHIRNVISRVTGGAPSTINGTLKSGIGRAAFYFINPAGIVFGEHAQVDVPGAFYASTAGELQFADGSKFSATNPQGNTLSMAAPEAFGFLGKQTGTMAIKGADLVFKSGAAVHLSAGKISMASADNKPKDKASITGEGMDLRLISVGNAKQAVGVKTLPNKALSGSISIINTVLDASGNGKGRIAVRAGDVTASNSQINANNTGNLDMPANQGIDMRVGNLNINHSGITSNSSGDGDAGNVNINVKKELTLLSGGNISSTTFDKGDAGMVSVNAETVLINGQISTLPTGIGSATAPSSTGIAGTVNVDVHKELTLVNGGTITSSNLGWGEGDAGNVIVRAEKIEIDGQNSGIGSALDSGSIGNSASINVYAQEKLTIRNNGRISAYTFGKGDAGNVTVKSGKEIALLNGGSIVSITFAEGDAGNVNVKAGNILLDSQGSNRITRIGSDANPGSGGNAGNVYISAERELAVIDGSDITSLAAGRGKGKGGNVVVESGKMVIDGKKAIFPTGIFVDTIFDSSGNAGTVNVSVKSELKLLNRGSISSNSFSSGNAGAINIKAGTIIIKGQDNAKFMTGITSASAENSTGKPGSVNVTATKSITVYAGDINISSGEFSAKSKTANAKLTITTPQLNLSNNSRISAEAFGAMPASPIEINTSRLSMDNNSSIKTATSQSDGGPITINANDWVQLKNSRITTSVGSDDAQLTNIGNGGDITINTDVLVLDTGFIQANTNRINASGGDINLNVKQLVASSGNLKTGGNTPLKFIPDSGINVIQAAAPDGINGAITNTAPQLNIVGALAGLNTPPLDLNRVGHDPCSSIAQQSTMKKQGKGGIPYFNKGQDSYTIDRLLTKQHDRAAQSNDQSKAIPDIHDCQSKTNSYDHKI